MDAHTSRFWSVVNELDDVDKARLLRFVTSCERPPSLGKKTNQNNTISFMIH